MSKPLLDESPKHAGYSAIKNKDLPTELEQRTIEEAAAALRDRLPGRSRRAKGRFRRSQRGQKGDEWRGRLSAYCEASSYDLEKLTTRLREEKRHANAGRTKLYAMKWRVKAHFDALHLQASSFRLPAVPAKFNSFRNASTGEQNPSTPLQVDTLTGYQTYDTEISDNEGKGGGLGLSHGQDLHETQDVEEDFLDIFLFAFGPCIFWGFLDEQEEREILRDLREFVDGAFHDVKAADDATEEMEFTYRDTSRILNDIVNLTTYKSNEKLSVSSAVAQSCHLSIHEWRLGQTITRNSHIPKQLAETGIIDMQADVISKEIGRLFVERYLINLEPELLDESSIDKAILQSSWTNLNPKQTPEFLWNDAEFELVYGQMYRYLEIETRLDTLNKRLAIVGELLDVLRAQQEHVHANKLEWIIIVLVGMEVILQLVWNVVLKDVLGWVGRVSEE